MNIRTNALISYISNYIWPRSYSNLKNKKKISIVFHYSLLEKMKRRQDNWCVFIKKIQIECVLGDLMLSLTGSFT
jgi:hypothetical protein